MSTLQGNDDMPNGQRFFSLIVPTAGYVQFWCVDTDKAFRVGVPSPERGKNSYLNVDPSKDLHSQFVDAFPNWPDLSLHELALGPGGYYARMVRPTGQNGNDYPTFPTHSLYEAEIAGSVGQLISLVNKLRDICQVVEPAPGNLDTFGHAIRECLLVASTEIESHWKAVLVANGVSRSRFTTNDYVKTLSALKLDQYELELLKFPLCGKFAPFQNWNASAPTTSLAFYDAYNSVKHDRESEFAKATLKNSLEAVSGCFIMAIAQFGYSNVVQRNRDIAEFFKITRRPDWQPNEIYCHAATGFTPYEAKFPF